MMDWLRNAFAHKHRLRAVDAQPHEKEAFHPMAVMFGNVRPDSPRQKVKGMLVLWRCDGCAWTDARFVEGHWSLESLNGTAPDVLEGLK